MRSSERMKRKGGSRRAKRAAETTVDEHALRERVAQKAYKLYQKRDRTDGCDVEDWLEAERLLLDELGNQLSTSKESTKGANRSKAAGTCD